VSPSSLDVVEQFFGEPLSEEHIGALKDTPDEQVIDLFGRFNDAWIGWFDDRFDKGLTPDQHYFVGEARSEVEPLPLEKYKQLALYGQLRQHLCEVFRKLAAQRECRVEEGHLMPDHVHMMLSIPPKYAVSQVVGFIKGKSAIHLARVYGERKRNFVGQHFWARGYFVSTVGRDETVIREYIKNQEKEDERMDQLGLWR